MDEVTKHKIERFLSDKVMTDSVYNFIVKSFLRPTGLREVQIMAAERMAIELFNTAWIELERLKKIEDKDVTQSRQIGL
jgi:hypothetical protein